MADINNRDGKPGSDPPAARDEAIRQGIELLFFAYRDFTAEPDAILEQYGFGRAHHRVVHFVGRHPQMTVGELLGILRITKQSLNRVLGQLVRQGTVSDVVDSMSDSGRTLVRTPDVERLTAALGDARVTAGTEGEVYVTGMEAAAIGDAALKAGVALHQLTTERPDLEDVFLELTKGKADIR